jgi:tetratricopeptide (TPR) repeat protein
MSAAVMAVFFAVLPANAESFKSWAARGAREEREKDPKAAFSSYSNALSMWEEDDGGAAKAKVLCARAGLREQKGDAEGALADLSDCVALDKKNAKAFHRRGALRLKARDTQKAIGDFYRAIAIDIRFAQAYADRAAAYESQGEKGFAHEDYRQACSLGVKAACAKAKALAPKPAAKGKVKEKPKAVPSEAPAEEPVPAPEAAPEAPPAGAEEAPAEPSPAAKKRSAAPSEPYRPRFKDCLAALEACVDNGDSFGACVRRAPNCDARAVKGCCPAACLKAYQKSLNRERSEAEAYREHFIPDAACGAPPKEAEQD